MHMKTNGLYKVRGLKPKIIWILLPVIFLVLVMGGVVLFANRGTLPQGVSVSGWDAGGLTYAQFERSLTDRLSQLEEVQVVLNSSVSGVSPLSGTFNMGQLGTMAGVDAVTAQLDLLRRGSVWDRAKARWEARGKTFHLNINFRDETLKKAIGQRWPIVLSSQPKAAKRLITAADHIQYEPEQPAYRVDFVALEQQLRKQATLAFGSMEADADLRQQAKMHPARLPAITLPVKTMMPDVTVAKLKAQGIERKIGQFSTPILGGTSGRLYNIRAAANVVHDMLLAPGEVFDYAKVIDQTKHRYGFKKAPVILNGHLVPGIGGGICQVSTTLYNVALRSGLEIVQRQNHSRPIRYAPKGQDATFAEGQINFKFRNTTAAYLLLRTETTAGRMTVKLFGSMPRNVSYTVESRLLHVVKPPVKYVRNTTLSKGGQMTIQPGLPGYIVETYRYKKVDGKIVSQEKVSRDTYRPQPLIIARNSGFGPNRSSGSQPAEPNSSGRLIIEDGVGGPAF